ncbi:MAG: hypothetical protein HYV27_02660 [Candidatus Hydrogenedentes bacterium]|nr:hypothetical protein [Candidatus Hydrogenedentota bacterium]
MPCKDVTEMIRVEVDAEDRLTLYRFIKRTCGQGVGTDTLILPLLQGKTVDEILALQPLEFIEEHPVEEEIEEFLNLKHLIAVQSTLEVLTGKAAGGPNDICAAAEIQFEDGMTIIEARISVDLVTEEIKSCGGCKGCGKNKKAPKKAIVIFN